MAGPDYRRPELTAVRDQPELSGAARTVASPGPGGAAQRLVRDLDIRADWWRLFESPVLDELIAKALAVSPDIEKATAALQAAQENVLAQRGFFYPAIGVGYSPERTKIAGNLGGNSPGIQGNGAVINTYQGTPRSEGGTRPFNRPVTYSFHTAQLTVGYSPDVFGSNRRQVESLQAQAEIQRLQLEATRVTLASNVVAAAIQDALLREQVRIVGEMITGNEAAVALAERQLKAGYISALDLSLQTRVLAQNRQALPLLHKQLEQNRNLLRMLTGAVGGDPPGFTLDSLRLPETLPLRLPADLVEQRPDVRAAEEQFRSASAQIGVARAARLPQLSIDGSLGGAAANLGQMFWNSGQFFSVVLGLTQPLFDGGSLRHRERAAQAEARAAAAQYRTTVLTAWQDVADTLQAIRFDAEALKASTEAADASRRSLELVQRQLSRGYLDRMALISAQQADLEAQLTRQQARAARLGDTAALFQALGGGWWHRSDAGPSR